MVQEYNMDVQERSVWQIAPEKAIRSTPEPPFRAEEAGEFWAGAQYYTARRDKNDRLLLFTLEGEGRVQVGDRSFSLAPGEGTLLDCRLFHRYETGAGGLWHFLWVHFKGDEDGFYREQIAPGAFRAPDKRETEEHLRLILAQMPFTDPLSLASRSRLIENLLFDAARAAMPADGNCRAGVEKALEMMKTRFCEPLTLEELASAVHLSKYHFLRLFKDAMQTTPHRYLLLLRVGEAKKLLRATDLTLAAICEKTGFADTGHFCRVFKQMTGQTPRTYRRTM